MKLRRSKNQLNTLSTAGGHAEIADALRRVLIQSLPRGNGETNASLGISSVVHVEAEVTPGPLAPPDLSPLLHTISSTVQMSPSADQLGDQGVGADGSAPEVGDSANQDPVTGVQELSRHPVEGEDCLQPSFQQALPPEP